ncbi:hypothetical protein AB4K20DRAFT_1902322 [Rhizopus microsporus]|uniref:Uncharacterized protein n=1 Tax=Rhizopus microsporus TaxID=58291 RepID=A0A1X0RTG7_RHIZD|nr:hypothetical protein BCV71DRAFT_35809 [Rhizopus microsporus]
MIKTFILADSQKKVYMKQSNHYIHNYDSLSTYRCRATSAQTDNHICQPYTLFIFANCDNTKEVSDEDTISLTVS